MKEKNNRKIDELARKVKVEELKKEFVGLTREQRELLLYRKIIETDKFISNFQGSSSLTYNKDELLCLIEAADAAYFKPLIVPEILNSKIKYQEIYKESLVHYNKILENYRKLAQDLGVNSSLDLSHLFTYMLWNGYFSVTKEHFYKLQERLLLPGMYSFDVIKGKGVCLAYAELLHNYLSICGKKSSILTCKVPMEKNAVSCNYRPEIERRTKNSIGSKICSAFMMFFLRGLINKFGNHAVTLIEENGKLYIYDSTNLYVLNIQNASTASIINGKGEFQIKPLMAFIINPHSDPNHLYEKLLLGNIKPALTRKEFIFSFENIIELINNNINLLNDAYDNIHSDLEYIDKQTNEIGGYHKALKKIKNNEI